MLDILCPSLRTLPDHPALSFAGETWTFAQLEAAAAPIAAALHARGVRPGDRVVGWLDTAPALVAAMIATWRLGAAWVPVSPRYREAEVGHVLRDATPRAVVTDGDADRRTILAALVDPDTVLTLDNPQGLGASAAPAPPLHRGRQDALALLLYTSGTTGPAKGVEHTPRSIAAGIGALTALWRFGPTDRLSLQLPLFHVHGLGIGVIGSLLRGVHLLLHRRFSPAALVSDAREHGATVFMGVPTMYWRLLEHLRAHPGDAAPLAALRLFTSGSAALPAEHFAAFEALTGHRILERYGMTETLLTLSNALDGPRRPGTVGRPVGDTEVRLFPDPGETEPGRGELAVRGSSLMRGYRGQPEVTAACFRDGFFRTGDEAVQEADGVIRIVGRRSTDLIKSGGYRIAAPEIEGVLLGHAAVREVAVFGVPDAEWGERVVAAVVPAADLDAAACAALPAALAEHVGARLAPWKAPREVRLVEALPRNALGKVRKSALRRAWEEPAAR